MNLQLTADSINIRIGSWIVWYCIAPHMAGWRRYWPDYPPEKGAPPERCWHL
jgi:hypothetical protein